MNHLIVGYGEIGQAIEAVLETDKEVTIYVRDPNKGLDTEFIQNVDILHVCFPYSDSFITDTEQYVEEFGPAHVIIYATVPIGTTHKISPMAVHSPVEGVHPHLEASIRLMERWIGCEDKIEAQFFVSFFENLGLMTRLVGDSDYTEALKLLSTTEYGVNLMFADYKASVAEEIGMDFELTKEWNRAYNRLYKDLGMEKRFQKFVLDAPRGTIGGHCVVPNAQLLNERFPYEVVEKLGRMG